jgi:hypothetical protein
VLQAVKDVTALQRPLISNYAVTLYTGCCKSLSVAFEEQDKAVPIAWIYSYTDHLRKARLEDISKLSQDNKNFVLNLIDIAIRDFKAKKAYTS